VPAISTGRGGNTLEQVAPNRRQIAVTSFDLLNGAYQTSARNRRISVILLAAVIIGIAWQGGHALQNQLRLSDITAVNLEMKERQRSATARFSATTGLPDGVSEQQLLSRYDQLTIDLKQVSVSTATPFEVLANINDPAITISSVGSKLRTGITIKGGKLTADSADSNGEKDGSLFDDKLFAGLDALKPGEVVIQTTVIATAEDVAELTRWAQRVRDANIFANIVIERVGTVYTLTGVQVQSKTPMTVFTPWTQAGLPIELGDGAAEGNATP
jgi:hypothetical protein